ncbi:iron chaperone [Actinokineospora sp. HUAS TT18]|uniref:iron chaperone n=1 Tax=Actinokineospora sp. HUAS TT18 TaxID=3447451 RepID=UPI003F524E46
MATTKTTAKHTGFSEEEIAAMKEHAQDLKRAARRGAKADTEPDVLAKIAEMAEPDRTLAEQIHAIVRAAAPDLMPKLWYGMPSYARDGKIVCFFQPADKFKARYSTLGFNDAANLDDGTMWPTSYALTKLTAADKKRIGELVKQAAS